MPGALEGTALLGIAGRGFSAWASAVLAMRGRSFVREAVCRVALVRI